MLLILVDENDTPCGEAEKLFAHQQGLKHRAFSIFLYRKTAQGQELLLQKRAAGKYHCAALWTNTCCSHPQPGETTQAAAQRRLQEELGIVSSVSLTHIDAFNYEAHLDNGLIENEFDHVFLGEVTDSFAYALNPDEIEAVRWLSPQAIAAEYAKAPKRYTPWFKPVFESVCAYLEASHAA